MGFFVPFLYLQVNSMWKGHRILKGSCSCENVAEDWKNPKRILLELEIWKEGRDPEESVCYLTSH